MRKVILIAHLILLTAQAFAQDEVSVRMFGGEYNEYGSEVIQTSDGGYAIIGTTGSFYTGQSNMYLLKLDSDLEKEWSSVFGGSSVEWGHGLVEVDDGYLLLGYTNSFGAGGYDVYLVKCDPTGNTIWQKTFGGSDWDFGYALLDAGGSYYIAGETWSFSNGQSDGYLIQVDEDGNELWSDHFGGTGADALQQLFAGNENIIAVGTDRSTAEYDRIQLIAVASDNTTSNHYYGSGTDHYNGFDGLLHSNGDYYVTGAKTLEGLPEYFLLRLDLAFNTVDLNNDIFGADDFTDIGYAVVEVSGQQLTIVGESDSYTGSVGAYTLRCTQSGSFIAGPTHGGGLVDIGRSMLVDAQGRLVIAGESNSYGQGNFDVYLLRFSDDQADQEYVVDEVFLLDSLLTDVPEPDLPASGPAFYPNPSEGQLFLAPNHEWSACAIFDLRGQLKRRIGLQPGLQDLQLSLPSGSYFIEFTGRDGYHREKLVIER